jgi:hypothetical protein
LIIGPISAGAKADRTIEPTASQQPTVNAMSHLIGAGLIRSRMEAAHLGIALARQAQLTDGSDPPAVGAAIGSFHHPGRGTLVGAHLAQLLASAPDSAGR